MRTKKVQLVYTVTPEEVVQPSAREIERKNAFIASVQKSVPSLYQPMQILVTYELYNPEVDALRNFFHVCVKYYGIQNSFLIHRELTGEEFQKYREEILDELLGYDYTTTSKVIRKRESTSKYRTTQPWLTLLKNLEETLFEVAGYDFPDSKRFEELKKMYGYEEAGRIAIRQLQDKLKKLQ